MRGALLPHEQRGLLLGVTPELASLSADVTAVDRNSSMIQTLASGAVAFGRWQELPFTESSFDFTAGDGSFNMLHHANEYSEVFTQLAKVLRPAGKIILRLFATPEEKESLSAVFEEAYAGNIGSFHAFKWRMAMAMVGPDANIKVADIHAAFEEKVPDREKLARAADWQKEQIDTIDVYKDSDIIYSFPTLSQFRKSSHHFARETAILYGSYELAQRCPILILTLL